MPERYVHVLIRFFYVVLIKFSKVDFHENTLGSLYVFEFSSSSLKTSKKVRRFTDPLNESESFDFQDALKMFVANPTRVQSRLEHKPM